VQCFGKEQVLISVNREINALKYTCYCILTILMLKSMTFSPQTVFRI
jgi:hypothetical protein